MKTKLMKKYILSVSFFLCSISLASYANSLHNSSAGSNNSNILSFSYQSAGAAQVNDSINPKTGEKEVYTIVDEVAAYPGGQNALLKYISNNLRYPTKAQESGVQGRVYVRFVITDKGEVGNINILHINKSVQSNLLEAEAMRVVSTLTGWTPGKKGGKNVSMYYVIPVNFVLQGNKATKEASCGNATSILSGQVQNPLIESKSIVGFWRQCRNVKNSDGSLRKLATNNFTVINADNTFCTFVNWSMTNTSIVGYGTYKITSDSTYTEHIIKHGVVPKLSNTNIELRYKMVKDDVLQIQYHNAQLDKWMPEYWERVTLKEFKTNGLNEM
jgi:TonB family C-terminal domain